MQVADELSAVRAPSAAARRRLWPSCRAEQKCENRDDLHGRPDENLKRVVCDVKDDRAGVGEGRADHRLSLGRHAAPAAEEEDEPARERIPDAVQGRHDGVR